MAQQKPERLVVTQESPNLLGFATRKAAAPGQVTFTGNAFGNPYILVTDSDLSTKTSFKTTQTKVAGGAVASVNSGVTRGRLTNTVITVSLRGRKTIYGSVIPLTTRDARGSPIRSGFANAYTTIPIEPTALAAIRPSDTLQSHTTGSVSEPTAAPAGAVAGSSSKGLSSGQLAAAVVVPILVVLIGALLGFFLLRRRRQRQQASGEKSAARAPGDAPSHAAEVFGTEEKRQVNMPFITSTTQNNYNTGLDSVPPSTTSGSGLHGTGTTYSALPLYTRNQHGGSNLSNPFTDGSAGSSLSRKGSDMFAGFSGVGTDRSSSGYSSKGHNTPARAVSPVPEAETRHSNRHENNDIHNENHDDDAVVSDMSDMDDDEEADVQVAQAHMGRAHRASVITMRGMTSASNSNATSPSGSPQDGSVLRNV